jgi:DNA-directed RNA polymerase specialized sigma24 family protein
MGRTSGTTGSVSIGQAGPLSVHQQRFSVYFPRVFACAYALTGDENAAKDIVSEAFVRAFAQPAERSEEDFIVELFAIARDLSRAVTGRNGVDVTDKEREVLAFVFDARLAREEIRRLMDTTEQGLSATLLRAMRKLRSGIAPAALKA